MNLCVHFTAGIWNIFHPGFRRLINFLVWKGSATEICPEAKWLSQIHVVQKNNKDSISIPDILGFFISIRPQVFQENWNIKSQCIIYQRKRFLPPRIVLNGSTETNLFSTKKYLKVQRTKELSKKNVSQKR